MNAALLRGKMAEAGFSQRKLASFIGISPNSINRKLNGKREFTIGEAIAISTCLHLSDVERTSIFLPDKSQICNESEV